MRQMWEEDTFCHIILQKVLKERKKKKCIIISPTFLMTLQGTEVEHTIWHTQ